MSERPNVLLLFSDEHSFRFLGSRTREDGGEDVLTPAFDRLIAEGTNFADAYCQMPLCTPSRICTLTGKHVRSSGAWSNQCVLRPELPTIASVLRAVGYRTGLIGKMHLGGTNQLVGFEHRPYGDLTGKCGHQWEPIADDERHDMRARTSKTGVTQVPESMIQDEVTAQETLSWIRERSAETPDASWFACAGFSRPHFPLTAPKRWIDYYTEKGVSKPYIPASGDAYDHPMSAGMRKGFRADEIDEAEMMKARTAYFACVSYLDEVIGDLLVRLAADGALDNTVVVYFTDHGEMAGEHGVWWKNGWYEACTGVPLIISTPAQRSGTRPANTVSTPVGLVDLMPTVLSLAGVDEPDGMEGSDISAVIGDTGAVLPDKPVFTDALTPRWGEGTEFRSIRYKSYKYVRFRNAEPLFFNIDDDPGEQKNLLLNRGELTGDAFEVLAYLKKTAAESMDFDEAERERTVRDGDLSEVYAHGMNDGWGNLYWLPDGRLVEADDPVYSPTVRTNNAGKKFLPVDRQASR